MNRGLSLWLDAARVGAAFVVLLSHFAYAWASGGGLAWIRDWNLGSDAVVLFFVLSGLVIAHTTALKDHTPGGFALARLSRLYSVAAPALLISVVCALLAQTISPHVFASIDPGDAGFSTADIFEQVLRGLTFTNYVWWDSQRIVANGPYWSVAYEFWHYAIFGAAVFLRGPVRIIAIAAICALLGPKVLLLLPCWLAGVAVQRVLADGFAERVSSVQAWLLALLPAAIYVGLLLIDMPHRLNDITRQIIGGFDPNAVFSFSDEFLWNFVLAVLVAAHFLGMSRLLGSGSALLDRLAPPIRWISGRTFSIYLFHMPLLKLGACMPGYDPANPLHAVTLLCCAIAGCLVLAEFTERRLPQWRGMIAAIGKTVAQTATRIRPAAA